MSETDAEYLNRTLAPEIANVLNQIAYEEGVNPDWRPTLADQMSKRSPRVYRQTFKNHGDGHNTYMIRYTRIKDDDGVMWAGLYRKRGKQWNLIDDCEAKTRKVIDRKIQTWRKRYDA